MSSYYSNLVSTQNELSNSLASENVNIEANNIRKRGIYKQQILKTMSI